MDLQTLSRTLVATCTVLSLAFVAGPAMAASEKPEIHKAKPDGASARESASEEPEFGGPIELNPNPTKFSAGALGEISVSGAVTGYGLFHDNRFPDDRAARGDFSNLQMLLQGTNGPFEVVVQTGLYSIPSLGASNANSIETTEIRNFGYVPLAYGKVDLGGGFSLTGGQMTSVFGGEATFTYENLNIVRGLLFNQSNSINRGVQLTYEDDKLSASLALTDGFYSGRISWLLGAVSYQFDDANKVTFSAGGNFAPSDHETPAAPLLQNNGSMYNLGYTYSAGPWTLTPFIQATHVERNLAIGIPESASTFGGAFLASYAFTRNFSLAGRAEYIAQSGRPGASTVSLVYGPGSQAYSLTVTPTWKVGRFFARCEYSFVEVFDAGPNLAFGRDGTRRHQNRFAIEAGVLF